MIRVPVTYLVLCIEILSYSFDIWHLVFFLCVFFLQLYHKTADAPLQKRNDRSRKNPAGMAGFFLIPDS